MNLELGTLNLELSLLERAMGIEPTWPAWKAGTLPLSYARPTNAERGTRNAERRKGTAAAFAVRSAFHIPRSALKWWSGEDSNLRRLSQQIYSLPPLATREPDHVQNQPKVTSLRSKVEGPKSKTTRPRPKVAGRSSRR